MKLENKIMNLWIKNTKGQKSASLTLAVVAFVVVMCHMVASIFVNPFGLEIRPFDASEAMMVLAPLLTLYFGRRHTDFKEKELMSKSNKEED